MEPLNLVLWAIAFMIACIPVSIGLVFVGIAVSEVIKKHRKG